MEGAQERKDVGTPGVMTGELDGGLDRFGSRVRQEASRRSHRGDVVQPSTELGIDGKIEIARRVMEQAFGLFLDG